MNDEIERKGLAAAGNRPWQAPLTWRSLKHWMAGVLLVFCAANPMEAAKAESRVTAGPSGGGSMWMTVHAPLQSGVSELPMPPVAPFGQETSALQAQVPMGWICRLGHWYCHLVVPLPIGQPCWCAATPWRPYFEGFVTLQ